MDGVDLFSSDHPQILIDILWIIYYSCPLKSLRFQVPVIISKVSFRRIE